MLLVSWMTLATLHGHDNGKVKILGLITGRGRRHPKSKNDRRQHQQLFLRMRQKPKSLRDWGFARQVVARTSQQRNQTAVIDLARNAVNLTEYLIAVKGFADSSGNAAMNQKLSMDRAQRLSRS
jgi:hypothetical protein